MKSAKDLSGRVFSYDISTVEQFRRLLSQELGVPLKTIKLLGEEGVLENDHVLSDEVVYNVFVDHTDCLREWVPVSKLHYAYLSGNTHPGAMRLLEENLKRVHWSTLSSNPAAIHLLEQNLDKVRWYDLSYNQRLFIC